ncbi:MAG TPA: HEPN domain-containing protein [Pyrinomonadaceae bacterium]|nr:HEPN domain-containing protein [Pyrinomonadaceae bacterium]
MKSITHEWVLKAEGDFGTATRELSVTVNPTYDAVSFHAQRCAEKYLKARLQEADIFFGKTHDLTTLLDLLLPVEPTWDALRTDLQALTVFAVAYRYPGDSADKNDTEEALNKCRNIREIARRALEL